MKKTIKILLALLSYFPINSVAVAAQSKLNEVDLEIRNQVLRQELQELQAARNRLIPTGSSFNTIKDAKERASKITGLVDGQLDEQVQIDLQLLKNSGLIQFDEKHILSAGPSEYAM